MAFAEPVALAGMVARLRPLGPDDREALSAAAGDGGLPDLWYTTVPSADTMAAWIEAAMEQQAHGKACPFVVTLADSGEVVGSTRYMNIDALNRRLEIGTTWYARRVQRTALNTECKLLLLRHAFETLNCVAVEFRTHFFNHASRRAIERLGAKQDGVLRNHMIMADGTLRDTVVFSILASEWPTVQRHLQFQLTRPRQAS